MRNRLGRATAALAALASILAACSGGGGHSSVPLSSQGGGSGLPAPQSVPGTIPYGAGTVAGAAYVGRAHLATVGLDVHVALSNQTGLYQYARQANDPKSALYRRWLTPQQLGDRFGASLATYQAMTKAYAAAGITVKTYPQRTMLRISGPQAAVEQMLGVTFGIYRKNKQTFLAPEGAPHPPRFAANISALTGAVGYVARGRNYVRASNVYNNGYAPQQVEAAFDYVGAYAAGYTGKGINVGIIGTGPITDGDPRFSACGTPSDCGDVADFKKVYGVGGTGTVAQVFATDANLSTIPGENTTGLASPPPVTDPNSSACSAQGVTSSGGTPTDLTTCNPEDGEAQLDTEQVASLAYNANVLFYIAYNPNECAGSPPCATGAPEIGISLTDDEIQQAIGDDTADILTMSFGDSETDSQSTYFPSGTTGPGPTEFAMAAAEGMAVFASSGDFGAQGCSTASTVDPALCVSYPATDPNVVSVGGVNAPIDQSGRLIGPLTAWGTQTGSQIDFQGTGGGCSIFFPLLGYETGIAGETCTLRSQPDAALVADTNTGVAVDIDSAPTLGGRELVPVGGTSVAAPEMAAMWALVLQACKQNAACVAKGSGATPYRLGNPNAYFYTIYKSGSNGVAYANAFADVQYGDNTLVSPAPAASATPGPGFTAAPGYDLTTGLGVPYARNLIKAVVGV